MKPTVQISRSHLRWAKCCIYVVIFKWRLNALVFTRNMTREKNENTQ
jgi:hypothetical protein